MPLHPIAPSHLIARPLPPGEREELAHALARACLPTDDVNEPGRYFWRFETTEQVPLGYAGLEIFGTDALLRSVLTLPPAQKQGVGTAIVAALEVEALALKARAGWLITTSAAGFFERLGYVAIPRPQVPPSIRASREFSALCPDTATVMTKPLTAASGAA